MDAVELYLENIGEDDAPLLGAMGEEYTTADVKKMILDLTCLLGEEGGENAEINEKVLLRLLAFVAMEPVPDGMEEISDCDRYTCLRALDDIRKRETTSAETKKQLFLVQYLLRGYACHCR
ncbi:MAG: hypothetical protein IJM57_02005 [Lachnospiraceae bacterium]|nr:hypothetical protein [Lachnospiraceae bacterium]